MNTTFEAKYSSRCPDCPEPIEPGDEVVYVDDTVVHARCEEAFVKRVAEEESAETCTSCWQLRSVTGACGCEPE